MPRRILFTFFLLIGLSLLAACGTRPISPTLQPNIANPASVFCVQNGGRDELRPDASGAVAGICVFPDGSECDEWAYWRGECKPGDNPALAPGTVSPPIKTASGPAAADVGLASDGCRLYRNSVLGYSFHFPPGAHVIRSDDPLQGVSIIGPLVADEQWPQITLSHPADRPDYRPPEGVDLRQWLIENYLFGDTQLADVQIAGTTAVHLRHERSPQSYAYDRYYFARSGQLYMIVIDHVGDKEDWNLYDHFLQSLQFDS